ncbi:16S rRNA (cytidine(1402)-2'-O)-methyltransferase [Candidatus Kaiserbacteria bacterium]|nr:16S rRNA (cytidine(1402)-2'-O)-methyltransferase [Candidatus Kaiserbacteria bacterium]
MSSGILSIVATPIGNLEDITLRALRTLREADVVFAEDTRVAAKLLAHHEIKVPVHRCDAEVEAKVATEVGLRLERGERVVYISDAGTPGLSDPGSRLVAHVRSAMGTIAPTGGSAKSVSSAPPPFTIEAIPGPSALTALISIAGINEPSFTFLGFLPHKKGRQTALKKIAALVRSDSPQAGHPVVLYESPHRIIKLLKELSQFTPDKHVVIGRELTKMHEEVISGTPAEAIYSLESRNAVRGEFVVIVF